MLDQSGAVSAGAGSHERTSRFLLSGFEQAVLPRLARSLPRRVKPDHLTGLGLAGSTAVAAAYVLSNLDARWLWAASLLIVVQWFGDSLDGTLARVRRAERPRYGFYLDHLTDAYSTLAIGLGLGLSPYMLLSVGLSVVIAYLILSINVYLETHVFGEFSFSYGRLGPTEVRVLLILLNAAAVLGAAVPFTVLGVGATLFDVAGVLAALGMLGLLLGRATRNLRRLARLEPPAA
ncbi:MAG: CDP-alcohol phosphatidyltransferase family protein [Gemmatimonadetes bacterium]|nr:CDP-alcohol phosphatidyltransferase family protein [Gemmatimonadota bacterium]